MATIKVYELIGSEGRSRVNASKLGLENLSGADGIVLDFSGVDFLSRSFTDEVVTRLEGKAYATANANAVITNMFKAVVDGRSKARVRQGQHSVVKSFSTMAELSRFLNVAL